MTNYHLSGNLRGTDRTHMWVVDGVLSATAPEGPTQNLTGYVYPGLVDAHTHPGLSHTKEKVDDAEVVRRLSASRAVGVTHIREMGAQRDVAPLMRLGRTKVIRAGRHIARYKRYLLNLAVDVEPRYLPSEAAHQAQQGDGWVKIVGDWIDRDAGSEADLQPLWPIEALRDAVAAVHELGAKVAVHTFATTTIDDLLDVGVDSIEHGCGMRPDHMIEAASKGILVDPTVRQINTFPEIAAQASKYPRYRQHMLNMYEHREERLALMLEAGTHFLMGSDTAADVVERPLSTELQWAVREGMPASVAMAAASYKGRERLGLPSWEEGAPADLVIYAKDPEIDIEETSRPSHVMIDGLLSDEDGFFR